MSPDITEMTRKQLHLVRGVDLEGMDKIQKTNYLQKAHEIHESDVFQKVLDDLMNTQRNETMNNAWTELELVCGRMTINGISDVREKFADLNVEYEALKNKEVVDPFSII